MQELYSAISSYQYISFDIFDTLVKRGISTPTAVFDLVMELYNKNSNKKIYNLKNKRIIAEKKARKHCTREDISLSDIYAYIDIDKSIKNKLMKLECYVECNNCYINKTIFELYQMCILQEKHVIITSDMYLSQKTIEDMLKKLHITGYEKLYVSSEIGLTKRSGHLFNHILKDLDISGNELLHIGDDKETDYKPAQKYNISTFLIKTTVQKAHYWRNPKRNILLNHMVSCFYSMDNEYKDRLYELGYTLLGPFISQFCMWLNNQDKIYKFDKIVFVAREGFLLYRVYSVMFPEQIGKICYLMINRNTLRRPMLNIDKSFEHFMFLLRDYKEYTIRQVCEMLFTDINTEDCIKILKKYNYCLEQKINLKTMSRNRKFRAFYEDCTTLLRNEIYEQKILLDKYLQQNNITCDDKIALVNNSMHGSGQSYLQRLFPNYNFWGIHFVLTKIGKERIQNKCSIWFGSDCQEYHKRIFSSISLVFEHLLFEDNGTAKYYYIDNEKVSVACEDYAEEKNNTILLSELRRGVIDFAIMFKHTFPLTVSGKECLYAISRFLRAPKYNDALTVGCLVDRDYNGIRQIASKESKNAICLQNFIINSCSPWKQGVLVINNRLLTLKLYNASLHRHIKKIYC